jgi:hypothetical protein
MTNSTKAMLRAAVLIHEHLAGRNAQGNPIRLPEDAWQQAQRLKRQAFLAQQRGWHRAHKIVYRDLVDSLRRLQYEIHESLRKAETRRLSGLRSGPADVFRDLLALEREFGGLEIDVAQRELAVTTDPIVLERIDLGRFEIRLDWAQIGDARQPYRVVALDPHPAARNDSVTHPHVQDERLCEGDGRAAITAALLDGRLYDFFTLVSQVLRTYGKGSAFVELDRWEGAVCEECGDTMDEEDRYCCQHCDSTLCASCAVACHGCHDSYCSGCRRPCAACGEEFCSSCLAICRACRKRFCSDCLAEGLCPSCDAKTPEEDQDHDPCDDPPCKEPCRVGPGPGESVSASA